MRAASIAIQVLAAAMFAAAAVSPLIGSQSGNPCADCHGGYAMRLDILEGDGGNILPRSLNAAEVLTVTVVLRADCNAPRNNMMGSISATLASQAGHFRPLAASVSIGSLGPGQTAKASWQITAVSAGSDAILMTARGHNTHNNLDFADTYSPPPAIDVIVAPPALGPSIALASPARGDRLTGGAATQVRWTAGDDDLPGCRVGLYYSTDTFGSVNVTIATGLAADRPYNWTPPAINSQTVLLKATIVDAGGLFNESAMGGEFAIDSTAPFPLSVGPPDGASGVGRSAFLVVRFSEPVDERTAEAAFAIAPDPGGLAWSWNTNGTVMTAVHEPFAAYTVYSCTLGPGTKDRSVPGNVNRTAFSWTFETSGNASSAVSVVVSAPSDGDRHYWGDPVGASWSASGGIGDLTIDLSMSFNGGEGPWNDVSTGMANSGGHTFAAPQNASDRCVVKVVATDGSGNSSMALGGVFSIRAPLVLSAAFPPGGTPLRAGSALEISWNASGGFGPVSVELSFRPSPNATSTILERDMPPSGSRSWTVPAEDTTAASLMLRAGDGYRSSAEAVSDPLTIKPAEGPAAGMGRYPVALFGVGERTASAGGMVTFDATGSYDPDGGRLYYVWDFGDGTGAVNTTTPLITHVYLSSGVYIVRLTVGNGAEEVVQTMNLQIGDGPPPAPVDWGVISLGITVLLVGGSATAYAAFGKDASCPPAAAAPAGAAPAGSRAMPPSSAAAKGDAAGGGGAATPREPPAPAPGGTKGQGGPA